jgi:SAM-dependent methyltransferase
VTDLDRDLVLATYRPGWRIADLGSYACHGGRNVAHYVKDAKVIGFDLVAGPGVDVVLESGIVPPDQAHTFDAVYGLSAIQFAPAPDDFLAEAAALLKPRGMVVITMCSPACQEEHNTSRRHREREWRCELSELVGLAIEYFHVRVASTTGGTNWIIGDAP